jgi:2-polyprenyl-3-methyl-5-hydroxy-6-metoxy-1,4-benzoquinol methylase
MRKMKGFREIYYPELEFGGFTRVNGTLAFHTRVKALATPEMTVLDVGCGRGAVADRLQQHPWEQCRVLRGACREVIGIDVSDAGRENSLIDEFRPIVGDRWPVESASIDLLVSDAVLEHVPDPDLYFSECSRVVKPGGYICLRTPNRWSYVSLIASLVPNSMHARVVNLVQPGRGAQDVFPTYYRANTIRSVKRLLKAHHFEGCVYRHIAEPSYLGFSRWTYAFGVYLHRWLPSLFWPVLFVFGRRTGDNPPRET